MSDLIVDDDLLMKSARSLKKIQHEFEDTDSHQRDLKGIWGSGQIAGAMDAFADNYYWRTTTRPALSPSPTNWAGSTAPSPISMSSPAASSSSVSRNSERHERYIRFCRRICLYNSPRN
ncbi:hypothetical protein OHB54_10870 [Streptomyces sp. NBC_01007]|nr:hypothetical protein OHB54_10870 [Streptomyces sp. NBC_01007]